MVSDTIEFDALFFVLGLNHACIVCCRPNSQLHLGAIVDQEHYRTLVASSAVI
jgi:hypothetical protein